MKIINPIAKDLNKVIESESPNVHNMLSNFGKQIFFPRGILGQSKEVNEKNPKLKATIGMAVNEGELMTYNYAAKLIGSEIKSNNPEFELLQSDIYSYEQVSGRKELINLWRQKIIDDNPKLKSTNFSTPIPVSGITHGLFVFSDLFIEESDQILIPELIWGNYNLVFKERRGAEYVQYPFFDNNKFNIDGFKVALIKSIKIAEKSGKKKIIIMLNFPNNPTGYSPDSDTMDEIKKVILEQADDINIIIVCDDAYFGLFFDEEESNKRQSPFAYFADAHKNILAVKIDGATKEELSWGLRVGFITFGIKNGTTELYGALNEKVKGAVRSSVSSVSKIGQSLLLKLMLHKKHNTEKKEKTAILKRRALKVKKILENKKYDTIWESYPFNSGYFMTLKLKTVNAKTLWKELLYGNDVGVIYLDESHIRIAFSSIDTRDLEELFEKIYETARKLSGS